MANIYFKRPWIPALFLPGKSEPDMIDKLNVPGIDITMFRSFQYRTKGWRVEGYNPSQSSKKGRTKPRKEYRLNTNGFKAWKIGFKNRHKVPVDLILYFTMHVKDGQVYDYRQTSKNLLPDLETEVSVVPGLKTARIRLDTVEVYAGTDLLSRTELNSFMPFRKGSLALSFYLACLIGVSFLYIPSYKMGIPVHKSTNTWVSILCFYLAFWEAFNITPVIIMFLLLLSAPFIFHDPVPTTVLMVLGCFYLWAVWRKRSSIMDFLIGAFIP
jgi:hypothetical protein